MAFLFGFVASVLPNYVLYCWFFLDKDRNLQAKCPRHSLKRLWIGQAVKIFVTMAIITWGLQQNNPGSCILGFVAAETVRLMQNFYNLKREEAR